jgi:hypothetical protein
LSSEQDHCSPGEASCFGSLPVDHETTIVPSSWNICAPLMWSA